MVVLLEHEVGCSDGFAEFLNFSDGNGDCAAAARPFCESSIWNWAGRAVDVCVEGPDFDVEVVDDLFEGNEGAVSLSDREVSLGGEGFREGYQAGGGDSIVYEWMGYVEGESGKVRENLGYYVGLRAADESKLTVEDSVDCGCEVGW